VVKTGIPALSHPNFGLPNVACPIVLCGGKVNLCTGCVCGDICIEGDSRIISFLHAWSGRLGEGVGGLQGG
jgi:hypothetical protein